MATRNTDYVRYRYGICLNDNCEKCKSKEVQEIPARKEFVCQNSECGKPLRECPPPKKNPNITLLAIIAGVVAVLAIIGGIIIFSGRNPKVERLTLDKTSVICQPNQTETLNVTVEPNDTQTELIWQSSNEDIAKVLDGVITTQKAGKAIIKVFVKEQEDINAVCECIVEEETVEDTADSVIKIETLEIQEGPLILKPGGHQLLTVKCTPENHTDTILWSSSDASIATISPRGKVEAKRVGEAIIIAKSERTGIADTTKVSVEGPTEAVTPTKTVIKKVVVQQTRPVASSSRNFGYATFKGSWPNDVNGRMLFKESHIIDTKDPKKRIAEAGDYVIGEWSEGHLVHGIWYGADNVVKGSVIIGK